MQKERKRSSPARCSPSCVGTGCGRAGQRTWIVWKVVKTFYHRTDSWSCCFVILEIHKGAVFFVCSLCKCIYPISDEKEGAGNFDHYRYKNGTRLWKVRVKKQITIIVDVDDKNFLAQLTVALQLNQGVRQRLYIVCRCVFLSFFLLHKQKKEH